MVQKSAFKIDLNKIEGEGEFPCPSCGVTISPDDDSGATYDTIDIVTTKGGDLKELVIVCKKCKSTIRLEGFESLKQLDNMDETAEE